MRHPSLLVLALTFLFESSPKIRAEKTNVIAHHPEIAAALEKKIEVGELRAQVRQLLHPPHTHPKSKTRNRLFRVVFCTEEMGGGAKFEVVLYVGSVCVTISQCVSSNL